MHEKIKCHFISSMGDCETESTAISKRMLKLKTKTVMKLLALKGVPNKARKKSRAPSAWHLYMLGN